MTSDDTLTADEAESAIEDLDNAHTLLRVAHQLICASEVTEPEPNHVHSPDIRGALDAILTAQKRVELAQEQLRAIISGEEVLSRTDSRPKLVN